MSEDEQRRVRLTVTQVLGGAVAAMVGSLVASRLGVAGTILGAAVISVVATILTAININSMNHVRERTREARRALAETRLAQTQRVRAVEPASTDDATEVALTEAEAADLAELAQIEDEEAHDPAVEPGRFSLADRRGYHWGVIAAASLAVFVVAMVGITVIEKITGQSIACSLGADCDRPTTIPLPHRSTSPTPTPDPTPTTSVSGTPGPSVTVTVTPSPTGTASTTPTPTSTGGESPPPSATQSAPPPESQPPEASP